METPVAPAPQVEPTKIAEAAMGLMLTLTQVMDKEITLLKDREYVEMEALRTQKARLIREYQVQHQMLGQNPDLLKQAPLAVRERLVKTAGAFAQATERNAKELKAAVMATQSLLQTIMRAARKENRKTDCYGDPRKDPMMLGSYSPMCDPVAVSRII